MPLSADRCSGIHTPSDASEKAVSCHTTATLEGDAQGPEAVLVMQVCCLGHIQNPGRF